MCLTRFSNRWTLLPSRCPADRLFGRIEKEIKRRDTIIQPAGYHEILQSHGALFHMGADYEVFDSIGRQQRKTY